jgi:site-specific recombinase XerD
MAQPTHDLIPASDGGFLELRATTDPLFLIKSGYLSAYKGSTRQDYEHDLNLYLGWCERRGLDPLQAKRPHLQFYLQYLHEGGYASSTVSRRFGTVACMYQYAVGEELLDKDPTVRIARPKVEYDERRCTFLSPLELGRFMAAAPEFGPMAQATVMLLGVNALRIAEACSLNIEAMTVEGGYDVINFIGKGSKIAAAPLSMPVMRVVRAAIGTRTEGPILLNERGHRMRRANATLLVRKIARSAKVNDNISPHSLRRSFATTAATLGVALQDIQETLRHAQISTTMRYVKRVGGHDRNATHQMAAFLAGFG